MLFTSGARLGPYEIVAPLGAGGMGEVYKARDTRLDRTVAIKILPADVAADPQRRERFRREARAISSLTHAHICTLHDIGEQDGVDFLVMEYLPGETLAHRLLRGALPLEDVLRIAVQLADSLDAAHRAGLTHRDLKPANVMLTPGGAKVLDFGLAKWYGGASDAAISGVQATAHPTLTQVGSVVGTIQYMAPEQIEGKPVDARSDLFALGTILYEMTTGRKAFEGTSASSILAAILTTTPPPMSTLQPLTPTAFDRTVKKCLAKDPGKRWQTAADLRDELAWIENESTARAAAPMASGTTAVAAPRRRIGTAAATVAALAAVGGLAFALGQRTKGQNAGQPWFHQLTFRRGFIAGARFAPDGQTIVYAAAWDGGPLELFATRPDSLESRSLGLPSGSLFAISSTGEMALSLGCGGPSIWGCASTLARVPVAGGAPREVSRDISLADWSIDGRELAIVRQTNAGTSRLERPIGRVLYETKPGTTIIAMRFSPDGGRIAYAERDDLEVASIWTIDSSGKKQLIHRADGFLLTGLAWSPSGDEIWFTKSATDHPSALFAVTLSDRLRLVARVPSYLNLKDVSRDGRILMTSGFPVWHRMIGQAPGETSERDLSWLSPKSGDLSADGRTVLFDASAYKTGGGSGIYLRKTDGSTPVRLEGGSGEAFALSPDGQWAVVSASDMPIRLELLPTGPGDARILPNGGVEDIDRPVRWFPDGKRILFRGRAPGHRPRSFVQDVQGGTPEPLTPEGIEGVAISPDGTLIATDGAGEPAKPAIYSPADGSLRPIPGTAKGDRPIQWSADGHVVYVRAPGKVPTSGKFTSVDFPANVFRVDIATGRREFWKAFAPPDRAGLVYVDPILVTPDGRAYVYEYFFDLSELYLVDGIK